MTGAMRRRLLRILLNAATVLSLALCVVTVVTWMRSYGSRYGVELYFRKDVVNVVVYNGDLWIEHYLPDSATRLPERDWGWHVPYIAWYRYTEARWQRWTDYLISCCFSSQFQRSFLLPGGCPPAFEGSAAFDEEGAVSADAAATTAAPRPTAAPNAGPPSSSPAPPAPRARGRVRQREFEARKLDFPTNGGRAGRVAGECPRPNT